ncbi:MAG: C39 family peptidase [Lachnospiraceae bacterium]|nr:C39 family peptidase [Lachnospiraceae bacterium]
MKLISVPYIDQTKKYPTGCESISTVMLLQYLGYKITPETFINQYLPRKDFELHDGVPFGPDPQDFFIGSPYNNDKGSYGCYTGAIIRALTPIVSKDYIIRDETGTPMSKLITSYLDKDMPVIFWATLNMLESIPGPTWKLLSTGEDFTWKNNLHCLLLVGYDEENYYFNDPWENHGCIGYSKILVEMRHIEQYAMAVGLIRKDSI